MLTVDNLWVRYGNIQALHGVSLSVKSGEIVTLLGGNGAGKSTTLRAISGLIAPHQGSILYENESLHAYIDRAHEIVRLGLSHCPEGRRIFPELTVRENLEMGAYIHKKFPVDVFEEVMALFPRIKERLTQLGGTLSGGEQQMLAIGRALMQRPRLLMLDEPSLGIAPVLVENIFRALVDINKKGLTILLVEQNASAALSIAHRAYVLETGRTVLSGEAAQLRKDPRVQQAYLGM